MLMTPEEWRKYRKWRIGFAVMLIVVGGGTLAGPLRHHGAWGIYSGIGFVVTATLLLVDCGRRLVFPAMLGAGGARRARPSRLATTETEALLSGCCAQCLDQFLACGYNVLTAIASRCSK